MNLEVGDDGKVEAEGSLPTSTADSSPSVSDAGTSNTSNMKTPLTHGSGTNSLSQPFLFYPVESEDWWKEHVIYSKFNRQGINIICARFEHKESTKGNVVFITGWSETFLKYPHVIRSLYEMGYNVHTYDHQSQGLSDRWLHESQSTWVHTFEDYVDDFVYFVTTIKSDLYQGQPPPPTYLVAHSMGGLIASMAMARLPALINRAVLCAPMFRNKCGMKAVHYQYPLPQPLAYWITWCVCRAGLGSMHALGFFKEESTDPLKLRVTTSDPSQLNKWRTLRQKHPQIMSTCVTNDWVLHSIRAQKRFADRYAFVQTNTLILAAEHDVFVHNRAMAMFLQKAPKCQMFIAPDSYHEILQENESIRGAAMKTIIDFFSQKSDEVSQVQPCSPLILYDKNSPIYSLSETIFRTTGIVIAGLGVLIGSVMIFNGARRR